MRKKPLWYNVCRKNLEYWLLRITEARETIDDAKEMMKKNKLDYAMWILDGNREDLQKIECWINFILNDY